MRVGVVRNPRSHANLNGRARPSAPGAVAVVEPDSPAALAADLKRYAAAGVEVIVVDGGDGTVREVLTALPAAYGDHPPALAVVPSGKTNILAFDLGVPNSWTTDRMLDALAQGRLQEKVRAPLELARVGEAPVRGFVFGAAGFVRGTALAGGAHRVRVFHNAAVFLALGGAVAESLRGSGPLREGAPLSLAIDGGTARSGRRLVMMATTLQRLPMGMRPFGEGPGLKVLDVDAPPRLLALAVPILLWTQFDRWLAGRGYRRGPVRRLQVVVDSEVVVDGEVYPGGALTLSQAASQRFFAP
jgi:diacylglycerol kinase (ATP)